MTFAHREQDFSNCNVVALGRESAGRMSYLAGLAAEDSVAAEYLARGHVLLDARWRGKGGEIDLVFGDREAIVIVEVKKSRNFETALSHVRPAQVRRLFATAEEYVGTRPLGSLTDIRFDVALVDRHGEVSVLENAFCGWV